MVTLRFLGRLVTLPYVIISAVVQYYTTGTALLRTNAEFRNSLYNNVHLAVEGHLANNFSRNDVATFVYTPVTKHFARYRTHPLARGLTAFGEPLNANTHWINKVPGKSALLFLHGGGYALPVFAAQFVGIMGLYHAVPEPKRLELSVAILDYSLTCHYKTYPTQIHEVVAAYRALVDEGYTNVIVVGDSAGTNLASALARYIAYPEEAKAHFSKFTEFEWDFSPLPQPKNMVYISPWLEPYTAPTLKPDVDHTGDLGALDTQMGDWYVEGRDRDDLEAFVRFVKTDYKTHWAKVDAFNGNGRCLYIYGDREILQVGVEKFIDVITKGGGHLEVHVEKGGIHDGLFYVESLGLMSAAEAETALKGDYFNKKYAYNLVAQFLEEVI